MVSPNLRPTPGCFFSSRQKLRRALEGGHVGSIIGNLEISDQRRNFLATRRSRISGRARMFELLGTPLTEMMSLTFPLVLGILRFRHLKLDSGEGGIGFLTKGSESPGNGFESGLGILQTENLRRVGDAGLSP
jgi:hypothetical protein